MGIGFLFFFGLFLHVKIRDNVQTLQVGIATESALGGSSATTDDVVVYGDETLEEGATYVATITFAVVERAGDGLLTNRGEGKTAYLKCSPMSATTKFVAMKPWLRMKLTVSVDPSEVMVGGETFRPGVQKLKPQLELEKVEG